MERLAYNLLVWANYLFYKPAFRELCQDGVVPYYYLKKRKWAWIVFSPGIILTEVVIALIEMILKLFITFDDSFFHLNKRLPGRLISKTDSVQKLSVKQKIEMIVILRNLNPKNHAKRNII